MRKDIGLNVDMDMDSKKVIIGQLLFVQNLAQLRHWYTSSYAEHVALQEFYSVLNSLIDSLAELVVKDNSSGCMFNIPSAYTSMVKEDGRILVYIDQLKEMLLSTEGKWSRAENNVIDDILTLVGTLEYKIKNLV